MTKIFYIISVNPGIIKYLLMAHLECLLGLQCNGFVMMAADQIGTDQIFVMKNDEVKIHCIKEKMAMGVVGPSSDAARFVQYITKSVQLYRLKNGYHLSTSAVVHMTTRTLAERRNQYMIDLLVGGYDDEDGAQLHFLDSFASCMKMPYATQGLGGALCMGVMDRYYRPDLKEAEAYGVLKLCVSALQERLILNYSKFHVVVVDATGMRILDTITSRNL